MSGFHTIVRNANHAAAKAGGALAGAAAAAAASSPSPTPSLLDAAGSALGPDMAADVVQGRAPQALADVSVKAGSIVLEPRRISNLSSLTASQILNMDNTSSLNLVAIIAILGGFITVFVLCILIASLLSITNRPRAEAFPYHAQAGGKGMYQPSANMGYGAPGGGPTKAAQGAGFGGSAAAGLLASAAPMGGREGSFAGSISTDSLNGGAYGQAPMALAGMSSAQHTRGASSGLGFPGPPSAARRGPGANAQQHPPLQQQFSSSSDTTLVPGGAENSAATAPDGTFQPGQPYGGAGAGGATPRLRNPLATGPPPLSDARRQSRYNRAGGGLNGGLGVGGSSSSGGGGGGGGGLTQARLRHPPNSSSQQQDRRSRIQSVGAGVYRKSMFLQDGGQGQAQTQGADGQPLRRVESISRGNSLRYRDGTGASPGSSSNNRQSRVVNGGLSGPGGGSGSGSGNGGLGVAGRKSWARYSQVNPMPSSSAGEMSASGGQQRTSIYGSAGVDAQQRAFSSAQRENFGGGGGNGSAPSDPLQTGWSSNVPSNPFAPANSSGGPPHLSINTGGNGGRGGMSSPLYSADLGGGMEYTNSPQYVVPSPHSPNSTTAPNYLAFQQQSQAALRSSAYNAAPQQYAGLRPGMPVRQMTGGSSSGSSEGDGLVGGGSGGAGADLDMFATAPLPRGASSYASASGGGGPPSFQGAGVGAGGGRAGAAPSGYRPGAYALGGPAAGGMRPQYSGTGIAAGGRQPI